MFSPTRQTFRVPGVGGGLETAKTEALPAWGKGGVVNTHEWKDLRIGGGKMRVRPRPACAWSDSAHRK